MVETRGARRLARAMALCAALGVAIAPIGKCVVWAATAFWVQGAAVGAADGPRPTMLTSVAMSWGLPGADPSQATTAGLIVAWLIGLVCTVPLMLGLWSVRRTFLESAEGRPFSEASVRSFRTFAWASFVAVIAVIVERTATGLAISMLSPGIKNQLAVGIGGEDVSKLFAAGLFVAVAHMFAEGRRLAEDVEAIL